MSTVVFDRVLNLTLGLILYTTYPRGACLESLSVVSS
jgi:hypothetical protein